LGKNEFLGLCRFNETYKRLGVDFDQVQYESNTYILGKDIIEEGLAKGVFFKKKIILFGLI
jgi:arginyl-tRNA synthetase